MLLQPQNAFNTPIKQLTQADTLRNHMQAMQLKIDSLEKIVLKTEIGTSFFSDVISTNLYVYTAIIGLTALLSWGWLANSLRKQKKLIEANLKLKMDAFQDDISVLKSNVNDTIFNSHRAMYWHSITQNAPEITKFKWSVRIVNSHVQGNRERDVELQYWLNKLYNHLIQCSNDELIENENDPLFFNFLELKINSEPERKIWSKVRAQIYLKLSNTTESPTTI